MRLKLSHILMSAAFCFDIDIEMGLSNFWILVSEVIFS